MTGIDIVEWNIDVARANAARALPQHRAPRFELADVHTWQTDRQFDVVFALGVMEHLGQPGPFLASLRRVLKPAGRTFVSIESFHSPIGDHMHGFFRVQIPWRGILFSEHAILRLRRECYRPADPAESYADIAGRLNGIRFW